jgi:UDP-N-acetylglucosamine 2-epimerase (non-hydrolysing)
LIKKQSMKILTVLGTRPEAIKMAPLIRALSHRPGIESIVCTTGQHQSMLDQVLRLFQIHAHHQLNVMVSNQTLNGLSTRLIEKFDPILDSIKPDRVLVHGDTTTAMVCAMAAFHRKIPVGHVEAGLRTHDMHRPWPEEMNRRYIDMVADMLFAPTSQSAQNLRAEKAKGKIFVTGNTVIDALQLTAGMIEKDHLLRQQLDSELPKLRPDRRLLLVTGHRRENFGEGFQSICKALANLAKRTDIEIVYPVHLNPNVLNPVREALGGLSNVHLIEPVDYLKFVRLMQRSYVILTDSGGVQEEAPAMGKPVLVMRDVTERPEAIASGVAELVGTSASAIVQAVTALFESHDRYQMFAAALNPYGDGRASERIVQALMGCPIHPACNSAAGTGWLNR